MVHENMLFGVLKVACKTEKCVYVRTQFFEE